MARRDYVSLRLAVDKGAYGALIFITDKSAGRMPFAVISRRPAAHLRPRALAVPRLGGQLIAPRCRALGRVGAAAHVQYVRVSERPEGEGEIELARTDDGRGAARVNRPERLTLRLVNNGAPGDGREGDAPGPGRGEAAGPRHADGPELGYRQQKERLLDGDAASAPPPCTFGVQATAPG